MDHSVVLKSLRMPRYVSMRQRLAIPAGAVVDVRRHPFLLEINSGHTLTYFLISSVVVYCSATIPTLKECAPPLG